MPLPATLAVLSARLIPAALAGLAIATLLLPGCSDSTGPAADGTIVVEGVVASADGSGPVVGATVRMYDRSATDPAVLASAVTGARGDYRLEATVPGAECDGGGAPVGTVRVFHPLFLAPAPAGARCGENTVHFTMEPAAAAVTASGTVASADHGAPIAGAAVELHDASDPGRVLAAGTTDAEGRYRLQGAVPEALCGTGEPVARVRATHPEYRDTTAAVPGCGQRTVHVWMAQDDPVPPGYVATDDPTSCAGGGGTPHELAYETTRIRERWLAEWGPHRVHGDFAIDTLGLGPGTVVCAGEGVTLTVGAALTAPGTATAPILLRSEDAATPWEGLRVRGRATLEHVTIRGAATAGLTLAGYFNEYSTAVTGHHLRIEEGGGAGLVVELDLGAQDGAEWDVANVRIVGNAGHPAEIPTTLMDVLVPDRATADSLQGNGIDAVLINYAPPGLGHEIVLTPVIPWRLDPEARYLDVRIPASATLLQLPSDRPVGWMLRGEGTAEAPARVVGGEWDDVRLDLHHTALADVTFHEGRGVDTGTYPVLDHVTATTSHVTLSSPGARVTDSRFVSSSLAVTNDSAAIRRTEVVDAPGDGLVLGGEGSTVAGCRIARSAGSGVRVNAAEGPGIAVRGCDLVDNVGPGIRNLASATVDATDNWWGSVDGPLAGGGDGVEGAVEYEPFRTAPIPPW